MIRVLLVGFTGAALMLAQQFPPAAGGGGGTGAPNAELTLTAQANSATVAFPHSLGTTRAIVQCATTAGAVIAVTIPEASRASGTLNVVMPASGGPFTGKCFANGSGTGMPGDPGAAATVALGSVTTLAPGASATVTEGGTSSARTFSFGIPAGAAGQDGEDGDAGAAGAASPSAFEFLTAKCENGTTAYSYLTTISAETAPAAVCFGSTIRAGALSFTSSTAQEVHYSFLMPTGMGALSWSADWQTTATTGDKIWQSDTRCPAPGTATDGAWTTTLSVTSAASATASSPIHPTITAAVPSSCAGRRVYGRISSSDALGAAALLKAFYLFLP